MQSFSLSAIFENPVIMGVGILVVVVGVLVILALVVRAFLRSHLYTPEGYENVTLLITVPKEFLREEDKEKDLKQLIGTAETLYANLGGMKAQKGLKPFFFGRKDHLALEIVAEKGNVISFYVTTPAYLQQYVEQQFHAQYPDANIEPVEDYNVFAPQGVILGAYVRQKKQHIFPVMTFQKLESDPLNALTNSLSRFQEGEGGVIQILVRSAPASWHSWPAKVASEMQQGKKLKDALKDASGKGFAKFASGIGRSVVSKPKDPLEEQQRKIHQLPVFKKTRQHRRPLFGY